MSLEMVFAVFPTNSPPNLVIFGESCCRLVALV